VKEVEWAKPKKENHRMNEIRAFLEHLESEKIIYLEEKGELRVRSEEQLR
jgi:hypothetical protein